MRWLGLAQFQRQLKCSLKVRLAEAISKSKLNALKTGSNFGQKPYKITSYKNNQSLGYKRAQATELLRLFVDGNYLQSKSHK